MKVLFSSKSADGAHNFVTDLDYGYSTIRNAMSVAITDPREQWYGISDDDAREFEHVIRYVRKTGTWEVGSVAPKMTITERVIAQVKLFPGYSAGHYAAAAGVTPEQFRSVARRRLTIRKPGDAGWDFSYTAYYPKDANASA